jgi:hypothetical protein
VALIQNIVERFGQRRGVIRELANSHHIDHGCMLTRVSQVDHVEVGDVVALDVVDEKVVDGVLVHRSHTLQPEGIGIRRVLYQGLIVSQM